MGTVHETETAEPTGRVRTINYRALLPRRDTARGMANGRRNEGICNRDYIDKDGQAVFLH